MPLWTGPARFGRFSHAVPRYHHVLYKLSHCCSPDVTRLTSDSKDQFWIRRWCRYIFAFAVTQCYHVATTFSKTSARWQNDYRYNYKRGKASILTSNYCFNVCKCFTTLRYAEMCYCHILDTFLYVAWKCRPSLRLVTFITFKLMFSMFVHVLETLFEVFSHYSNVSKREGENMTLCYCSNLYLVSSYGQQDG